MVQLTTSSLSKRQQELNIKVHEAAARNVNFDEVKSEPETSDVDKLFKIDLAVKYKNVDYIIETLKSGDSLFVSRAIKKAHWLYDDEFSNIINAEYLHHKIFPFMSSKIKKKILTAISIHVKNEDRTEEFYKYCVRVGDNNAEKFLVNTSELFKLKLIEENNKNILTNDEDTFMKLILKNSFVLFEAYLNTFSNNVNQIICKCSYLYSVSDLQYLDLLEQYASVDKLTNIKLGLRISKDIVTKHKDRILEKPKLYVNILNTSKLVRHSNVNDVKIYAIGVLPDEASEFWDMHYYNKYKPIIKAIPENERYTFVKKIFTDKYSHEEFDMNKTFYDQKYHGLMTVAEKEAWALRHISSGLEILGSDGDFIWYKFVDFEKAFVEIKKLIKTTTDQAKRSKLLKVLVHSTKTYRDIEKLLNYYYERHLNEKKNLTEGFIKKVISIHDVFHFDGDCWESLNKIFYSLDVYNMAETQCNPDFKIISILHHIINNKEMPSSLVKHLEFEISMYSMKTYINMLEEEKKQSVYIYVTKFYSDRIQKFVPGQIDHKCTAFIHFTLDFMAIFKKSMKDIPDDIMQYVNSDYEKFKYAQILKEKKVQKIEISDDDLVRYLKQDYKLVVDKVLEVKTRMYDGSWDFRLNKLLKKLKIYFSHDDVTRQYLKLFNEVLTDKERLYRVVNVAVYGIFQISDEKTKIDLMNRFVPTNSKVDYSNIDREMLYIQEAICRFACYSRPPVPLSNMLMYLKGDYVKYCLPMFHMYLANLPQPLCLKFVESLLDAPVSVQKHGLRLAFKCFSTDNLKTLILNAWKNTKNVSLRSVIYKAVHEKIVKEQKHEMYEILKALTLDLHGDDDDDIFLLLKYKELQLQGYEGDFIAVVWETVEKLNDKEKNVNRKTAVVKLIDENLHFMKKDIVTKIVSEYLNAMFAKPEAQTVDTAQKHDSLSVAKWNLVAHYIVYFTNTEEDCSNSVETIKRILDRCFEGWNDVVGDTYIYRQKYDEFIRNLKSLRFMPHPTSPPALIHDVRSYVNSTVVFEAILTKLQATLQLHEIYIFIWDLRISIICRKIVKENRAKFEHDNRVEVIEESAWEYGKLIGQIVNEFVKNKIYFSHFTNAIAELVKDSATDFQFYIVSERNLEGSISSDRILIAIVRGLLECNMVETNLLALEILPKDPKCDLSFYKPIYDAIQQLPEMEVKCCLHQKFNGDFKRRRLV